jgi:hypothetical protein
VADGERAAALAAAYGVAHLVGAAVLGVVTERSLPELKGQGVLRGIVASLAAAAVTALAMMAVSDLLGTASRAGSLVTLVVAGAVGVGLFALALPPAAGRSWRALLGVRGA